MRHPYTRRGVLAAGGALALSACAGTSSDQADRAAAIDNRVAAALEFLRAEVPGVPELEARAVGILVLPLITEAGFGVGGSYGEGALLINGVTVDYYSATQASIGFQIGAQQYAQALFFMTPEALTDFRADRTFSFGGDLTVATFEDGESFNAASLTTLSPVVSIVFGQAGVIAGATVEGTAYTRLDL